MLAGVDVGWGMSDSSVIVLRMCVCMYHAGVQIEMIRDTASNFAKKKERHCSVACRTKRGFSEQH